MEFNSGKTFKYLNDAALYYEKNLALLGAPRGCSEEEILAYEKMIGFSFPAAYKEFLSWMGNDRYGLFRGSNCCIEDLMGNCSALKELLEENNVKYDFPEFYLVFYMHQGYIAFWFILKKNCEHPKCYGFSEGEGEDIPRDLGNFSNFMT